MTVSFSRNYRRKRIQLKCKLMTPTFLGGADQEAVFSSAPIKAALRYWWRVSGTHQVRDTEELFRKESEIFGNADETYGKSKVFISVNNSQLQIKRAGDQIPKCPDIRHPEVPRPVNALAYLGGMGVWEHKRGQGFQAKRDYFSEGSFELEISFPEEISDQINASISLFKKFGTIGSRSRNALGSLNVSTNSGHSSGVILPKNWEDLFGHDYPHGLGWDNIGLLAWQSKQAFQKWEHALSALAKDYVALRSKANPVFAFSGGSPHDKPLNRHLLGYPITNHPVQMRGWRSNGRHASSLRFSVNTDRVDHAKLRIFVLHVPHAYAKEMMNDEVGWPIKKQQEIWMKVHQFFDQNQNFERFNLEDS